MLLQTGKNWLSKRKLRVDNSADDININKREITGGRKMSRRTKKITPSLLKRMIFEEAAKLRETLEQGKDDSEKVDADETDADAYAKSLEKDIDYLQALKIHESILKEKLGKVLKAKKVIKRRLTKKI